MQTNEITLSADKIGYVRSIVSIVSRSKSEDARARGSKASKASFGFKISNDEDAKDDE